MHNMIVYHYAFGLMKVIKEDKSTSKLKYWKDGLAPSLKKLIIDLNTRVFHKSSRCYFVWKWNFSKTLSNPLMEEFYSWIRWIL